MFNIPVIDPGFLLFYAVCHVRPPSTLRLTVSMEGQVEFRQFTKTGCRHHVTVLLKLSRGSRACVGLRLTLHPFIFSIIDVGDSATGNRGCLFA